MKDFLDFPASRSKQVSLVLLAAGFTSVGIHHWVAPDFYLRIMPDYLPWHLALVYISGMAEVIGGLGLLCGKTRQWACLWLLGLLLAVFPANINMLVNANEFPDIPLWALWVRLPLQFVAGGWIWWATRKSESG